MTKNDIHNLFELLSERDLSILESLRTYRALTTALIRRLHFPHTSGDSAQATAEHATVAAAAVATIRVLTRLESHRLIARMQRRIGGVRAGSSGITWQLGASGERLLRARHGETNRRRYCEPSPTFLAHTLAVANLATTLVELARDKLVELLHLEAEPECWRIFTGLHGAQQWLKPDLFAVTAGGDYEHHWFIEADNATEHAPAIARKAAVYQQYAASGQHQAEHGLFPAVAWIVPDIKRVEGITAALHSDPSLRELAKAGLFHVLAVTQFPAFIAGAAHGPLPV